MIITKTKYLNGLQCHKRLWVETFAADKIGQPSRAQQRALQQGIEVGIAARRAFPKGYLIAGAGNDALGQTQAALRHGMICLFEPAFLYQDILVRCDILHQNVAGDWEIVEVKASTHVKSHYLHDLAIQTYVLSHAGIAVGSVKLMHIDSQRCTFPDLTNLFQVEDVTAQVKRLVGLVPKHVAAMQDALDQEIMPAVDIGRHCDQPHPCPVKAYCWRDVPALSIFTIPRLSEDKVAELVGMGIYSLFDLPPEYPLTPAQRAYVERTKSGQPEIDRDGIRRRLATLDYPIYFFDFETHSFAIPRFDRMAPYQQVPFQYSCHVLGADGRTEHLEYLHMDETDPRRLLAEALIDHIGLQGSVVVYNAAFERKILQELAHALPDLWLPLQAIAARLWDQLDIFRKHYRHPGFAGSNSLKRVLPVLAPELTYGDLAIQKGDDAQAVWLNMIRSREADEKQQMAAALRAYCERDTQAMLEIHKTLHKLISER